MRSSICFLIILGVINNLYNQRIVCSYNDDCKEMGISQTDFDHLNRRLSDITHTKMIFRDEITIPLVFHVFNNPAEYKKIDESEIYFLLDKLNQAFQGQNYDQIKIPTEFRSYLGKSKVRFCIAQREINGIIEKGILFKTTDLKYFADQRFESDIRKRKIKHSKYGGSDQWDSYGYINIWVGSMISDLGTSTFPDLSAELKDEEGIIIDPIVLNFSKLGKILIHEMGHYFSLYHIWGNEENECLEDDGVGDTPQQFSPYYGCPQGVQVSCMSSDMYMNYMDYTDENCSLMFTQDQIARMESCLMQFRPGLLHIENCYLSKSSNNFLKDIFVFQLDNNIAIYYEKIEHPSIRISLYDVSGKKTFSSVIKQGETSYFIDKKNYSSGIYVLIFETEDEYDIRKLVIFDP